MTECSPKGSKGSKKRSSATPVPQQHSIDTVDDFIRSNKIAIFSKSWCPYCTQAKDLFTEQELKFAVLELDLDQDGACLQNALKHVSGQKTVPNIYVNSRHVGGYSELYELAETGALEDLVRGMPIDFEYDVIVIGGGSGGLAAAKEAASLGKKVAVCDFVVPTPLGTKWGLGGTCVNVGCIPKKLMHRAATARQDMKDAMSFGWGYDESSVTHNWEKMINNIQNHIKSLNFGYRKSLVEKNIKYFNAFASFIDKNTIALKTESGETQVTARTFIVAVGGRPKYLKNMKSKELCITSDDLFSMRSEPNKTLVVGGSYVALECAGFLNGLGYEVTVMARSVLLRGFDQQIAERIEAHMTSCGVKFVKNCVPSSFEKDRVRGMVLVKGKSNGRVSFAGGFNTVLLAVGRDPCTEKLNLAKIGVKTNPENMKILTDSKDRTSVSNIFALGDVADERVELTPVAIQAGKLLAQRLYNLKTQLMDYKNIPTTVFTPREYGCVGYTEDDALKEFGESRVEIYHREFIELESVLCQSSHPKGYAKVIVLKEGKDEIVIGAHIFSPNAGEIIQGFALGVKMKATKQQFDGLVGIHPTIAEIFTGLDISKSSGKPVGETGC